MAKAQIGAVAPIKKKQIHMAWNELIEDHEFQVRIWASCGRSISRHRLGIFQGMKTRKTFIQGGWEASYALN
jgi:hypothetical protein